MKKILISLFSFLSMQPCISQITIAYDDNSQRGYYDRPYQRYEAEPGHCEGEFVSLLSVEPYTQHELQSEASNGMAISLTDPTHYVEWVCEKDADALSLRFSLPDNEQGQGNKGILGLFVNGKKITEINLDSNWSWQYNMKTGSGSRYPDNIPSPNKFARMRFDEVYVKLPVTIKTGDIFSLQKISEDSLEYTIDFVELEKAPSLLTFEEIEGDKVMYEGNGSTLQSFINSNPGKIIYLPEGVYNVPRRILFNADNTSLIGAGMWYTTIYFSTVPSNRGNYAERGFESYASGIRLEGFSVNSASNVRYYDNNESLGVGKGLQGSFGKGSVIRNVRIDHFECGAWIGDYGGVASDGLLVEHCRFRNNYADGINLCSGTVNANVTHCSFRNNGDDDMASWSTGNWTRNNVFSYCTAENNWRASSLGFFGGDSNSAHHIVIKDALEGGMRINADFQGTGFAKSGEIRFSDISIYNSGCFKGSTGTNGDHWGNPQPSILIQPGTWYDINNLRIENVDIFDTRYQAISIKSNGGKLMNNLELHNIKIHGKNSSELDFYMASNLVGNGHYSNLEFDSDVENTMSKIPARFNFTESNSKVTTIDRESGNLKVRVKKGRVDIENDGSPSYISVYNLSGLLIERRYIDRGSQYFSLNQGIYILNNESLNWREKIYVW